MLRLIAASCLVAFVSAPLRGPCDLKTVVKKTWCPTCAKYVEKADTKGGACLKDKAKVENHDVCVKQVYVARCHPDRSSPKPVSCCGNLYDKPVEELAKVVWGCPECKAAAPTLSTVKHAPTCPPGKSPKKTCERSGTGQHLTVK